MEESFLGREDTQLTNTLLAELPGIMNWALRGLARLRARGEFKMPKSSREAMQTLEDLSSPVGAFVREWCEVGPNRRANVKVLFGTWRAWCEERGEKAGSSIAFGRNLRAAISHVKPRGSGKKRFYEGVGLNAEGQRKHDLSGKES